MNDQFRSYLRRFVLVFSDDILVYSQTIEDHINHLKLVLDVLRKENIFLKKGKCVFRVKQIEYLGYLILELGVTIDPNKVIAVVAWPIPQNVKQLRGFLGLVGYYRRFIQRYRLLTRPMTQLLKKNNFC